MAAGRGRRVIVAEVAARDDVVRALHPDAERAVFAERELAPGLHHISIDPEAALREYLADQLPGPAASVLAGSSTFGLLVAATPGLRELLTVGKVWELAQPGRRTPGAEPYDLVILDAPATGHGVAILQAPGTFAQAARVGPVARQGRTIAEMLTDPRRTAVLAVTTPEEMPVNETLDLRRALRAEMGLNLALVVANRVAPDRLRAADVAVLEHRPSSPPVRAALAAAARARAEHAQLARLRRGLGDTPCARLPLHTAGPVDGPALATMARRLERVL